MKNKKVFLLACSGGIFFALGLLLTLGTQKVFAGTCSVAGEICRTVNRDASSATGFKSDVGYDCAFRGTCAGSLTGSGPVEACCKKTATAAATTTAASNGTTFVNPLRFSNVEEFLGGILSAIQKIIVVLALVFIMIGAVMILTSAGSSGMVEKGKGAITMALVGLALGVAAPSLLKELANIIGWGSNCSAITDAGLKAACLAKEAAVGGALTLSQIAVNVLNFLLGTMGIVALVMMVIGAILYLTSAGDEDRIDKGKEIFKYSLIGVFMAMASMVLVTQIAQFFTTTPATPTMTAPGTPGFIGPPAPAATTDPAGL